MLDAARMRARLAAQVLVLDGAMAGELEGEGLIVDGDRLWSARALLEAPAAVARVHRRYLEAGADILTTAGYQVGFESFAAVGLGAGAVRDAWQRANDLALQEARRFAEERGGERAWVAASLGPWAAMLGDGSEYRGDDGASVAELVDFQRRRMDALLPTEADLLAFETVPSWREAEALRQVLDSHAGPPVWVSFCCTGPENIADGTPLRTVLALYEGLDCVIASGVNCCAPGLVQPLLESVRSIPGPRIAYPNRGGVWSADRRCWEGGASATEADVAGWIGAGARIVGGCCRTGPADIARIAASVH